MNAHTPCRMHPFVRVGVLLAVLTVLTPSTATPEDSPLRRAPTLAVVETDRIPTVEPLAAPEVRTLLGYTRRLLHLKDGRTMGVFSYSGSEANWLFLIDARDLSVRKFSIPLNDIASHGAALGADGNIYIMPYANGRAHIFDVSTETFTTLDSPIPASEFTWDAIGASNGRIYFGTYPNAYLGEFDPVTKQFEFWPNASPGKKYTVGFSETSEGKIRFKGWGPGDAWHLFDPETREISDEPSAAPAASAAPPAKAETAEPTEPPLPEGDTRILNQIEFDGVRYAITFPTSRFWEVASDGAFRLRGDPKAPAEMWWITPIDGVLLGLSHFGVLFRYDPASGDFESKQIDNHSPGGNSIMFLEEVGPDCAVGANYSQQNLWKIDPETGTVVDSQSMIARVTGEPMCALGFGGRAYLGIYGSSLISVYDPQKPFTFGVNPKELIELGGPYYQTRPRDFATDGSHVYMTSDSEYGHLTGALAVIDPRTNGIEVQYPLIADQNLPSLAFDPATGRLWGGTDRWGQMRSHPPTQESSLIYCYDPSTRKVVHQIVLWPGSDETTVYGVLPGGVTAAGSGGEIALLDSRSGEILYQGEVGFPFPSKVRIGMDGAAYGLTGGKLHRWEADSNTWTPVLSARGARYFCETSPGVWLFADNTTVSRGRIRVGESPNKVN